MRSITLFALMAFFTCLVVIPDRAYATRDNWRTRASSEEEITNSDVAAEISFGREIAARILGHYRAYDKPELVKYVSLVGLSLARNTNRPELEFHFTILDTNEVNAYAAPGGYVFVTKGALSLMQDESELAGVLAHEISHITEMHVVKELKIKGKDESATSGLAQLVGGSTESAKAAFAQAVDKGLEMIFKDEYKRADELQADKSAVSICALSGYDASSLARYLGRTRAIKEKIRETETEDTHPSFATRIAQINDVIAKEGIEAGTLAANQPRFAAALKDLRNVNSQSK